jgi:hypothetical protein
MNDKMTMKRQEQQKNASNDYAGDLKRSARNGIARVVVGTVILAAGLTLDCKDYSLNPENYKQNQKFKYVLWSLLPSALIGSGTAQYQVRKSQYKNLTGEN